MSKQVTRTFKTTTVKALRFELVNGKPEQKEVEISIVGNSAIKDSKVNSLLTEKHGKAQYLITETTVIEKTYGMNEGDFLAQATEVERPESQKTESQKATEKAPEVKETKNKK